MSLFGKLLGFGKREAPVLEKSKSHLAFVLLPFDEFPASDAIIAAFDTYAQGHHQIRIADDENKDSASHEVLMIHVEGIGNAFILLVPKPIPHGEAEAAFDLSVSSITEKGGLQPHRAHLVVTLMPSEETDAIEDMMAFTSLLAAVTDAAQGVGVYWGNARATHTREFFLTMASEHDISPRILLWNGVSRSAEGGGKMSFLSHGMNQLALPDLYLICDARAAGEAMGRMFDLLAYIASRREAIPAGDTIGATAEEKIRVHYVKSPADPKQIVWKVEM
jgi:hypothetical protein